VPVGEDIGFLPGTEEEKWRRGWRWKTTGSFNKSDESTGEWGAATTI